MADLILVAITFGFIALCVAYISWCDRIIGPDDFGAEIPLSSAAVDATRKMDAAEMTS